MHGWCSGRFEGEVFGKVDVLMDVGYAVHDLEFSYEGNANHLIFAWWMFEIQRDGFK